MGAMTRPHGRKNNRTLAIEARQIMPPKPDPNPARAIPWFDSLDEQRRIARILLGLAADEQNKGANRDTAKFKSYLLDASVVLARIHPFEHATLRAIEHKLPVFDLSRLTDEQLAIFESLLTLVSPADPRRLPGGEAPPVSDVGGSG